MIPAVQRSLDILELFISQGPELDATEIRSKLNLPKTSTHSLIKTLVDREYLVRVGDSHPFRYRLGVRTFELGSLYIAEADLVSLSEPVANRLSLSLEEIVQVGILDGHEVIPVVKVESEHAVRLVSTLGRRTPAHCTSLGKALLADLSEKELDVLYPPDQPLLKLTSHSLSTREALNTALADVRSTGLAREFCESNEAAVCVGAPIRDSAGSAVAAISVSVPTFRWSDEAEDEWRKQVLTASRAISRKLGYTNG